MLRAAMREVNEADRKNKVIRAIGPGHVATATILSLYGAAILTLTVAQLRALAYEERANVPADAEVDYVLFLEQMLLADYIARDRGSSPKAAVRGFQKFLPSTRAVLSGKRYGSGRHFGYRDSHDLEHALMKSPPAAMTPWEYPALIVAGPVDTDTKPVVAWLVTEDACYYSNTGPYAKRVRDGVVVVCRFPSSARMLVDLVMSNTFDTAEFKHYMEFVQGKYSGGEIMHVVRDAPRIGACSYTCVLLLLQTVLHKEKEKDFQGQIEQMKREEIKYLSKVKLVNYGSVDTRNCLRVMEAAAHVYEADFRKECADLMNTIEGTFSSMHREMCSGGTRSRMYTEYWVGKPCGAVTFAVSPDHFGTLDAAASWCITARGWMDACSSRYETAEKAHIKAVVCIFVEKMRGILHREPKGEKPRTVATVVMFLASYANGDKDHEALGIAMRCARVAMLGISEIGRGKETVLSPIEKLVSLPWVAAEFRALCRESIGKCHCVYDYQGSLNQGSLRAGNETARAASASRTVGVFTNHDVPANVWASFAELMKDESVMAFNAALVYVYSTCASPILTPRFALSMIKTDSGASFMRANGSGAFFSYVTDMPITGSRFYLRSGYSRDDDSAEYIKVSIADRVAASGVASASASDSLGVRMNIRLDDAGLARMDVDELVNWAEGEKRLWEDRDAVKRVAQHRTVEYCVAKFLEQPTVLAWNLANLEKLIESHESALAAILRKEFPKEPTTAQMRYAVRKGLGHDLIVAMLAGRGVGDQAVYETTESTHRPTTKDGAKVHYVGAAFISILSVTQAERRLVFECAGGLRGTIALALRLAGIPSEQWKYFGGEHKGAYMIQANGVQIWIKRDKGTNKATIGTYEVDTSPSEWSSLWYTTPCAAVFPVLRDRQRFLAVFVSSICEKVKGGITFGDGDFLSPSQEHLGTFFVVEFDAAGILPVCTPAEAQTLLSAFSQGSVCGVRLMPMVPSALPGCIYADHMRAALRGTHKVPTLWKSGDARFWYGAVFYDSAIRGQVLHKARQSGSKRLEYADEGDKSSARLAFEARWGKFVTEQQYRIIEAMKSGRKGYQVNMGVGKSAVIIPVLVLEMLHSHDVVVVTQPEHLVAAAFQIILSTVAAHPFVSGIAVLVTMDVNVLDVPTSIGKCVVVCSSTKLQKYVAKHPETAYASQGKRAYIADEVDEASDPLKCEVSWPEGRAAPHYTEKDALAYHRAVCAAINGTRIMKVQESTKLALESVLKQAREMKLNTQYGLIDEDGVYVAVPYKYADTPQRTSRYRNVDTAAVLTALAVKHACESTLPAHAQRALERALREVKGAEKSRDILAKATPHQKFLLHAVLVALPQVRYYAKEKVVSFVDTLGIAKTFAAFSGTMAFDLLVPQVPDPDPRKPFMPEGLKLHFTPDNEGNKLVESIIRGNEAGESPIPAAGVEFVSGPHTAGRAKSVIDVLQKAHVVHGHKLVVVDASGEFGLLGPSEFLQRARVFGEDGKLGKEGPFVYYDHRHSRGTDAVLDEGAVGYVVVDWETTTRTVAAQAMYRLRQLYDGKDESKKQSVVFVVCGTDTSPSAADLYGRLVLNEEQRASRLKTRADVQVERAKKAKHRSDDFVFDIDAGDVAAEQEQEQQQEVQRVVQQQQAQFNECVHVKQEPLSLDPFVLYDDQSEQGKLLSSSRLHDKLRELSVHLSPLVITNFTNNVAHRVLERAFVVMTSNGGATVVLCMQIETLVAYEAHKARRGEVSVYSASGVLLRGNQAEKGLVLFGRYLCGDEIPEGEQIELLEFLKLRYGHALSDTLKEVMECLVTAKVVRARAGWLGDLHRNSKWHEVNATVSPESEFIDEVMNGTSSFGRRRAARRYV